MAETVAFQRSHDIIIHASPEAIFNYVTNPNSWPEWLAASHHIDSPDRPLALNETFREKWVTRKGEVTLDWRVTTCEAPHLWIGETAADFIGPIIVRYEVVPSDTPTVEASHYTRTVINPARPKPPTPEMIQRMDDEAATGLNNIKRILEARTSP